MIGPKSGGGYVEGVSAADGDDIPEHVGTEVALQLKRVMGVYRLYGLEHHLVADAEAGLAATLQAATAQYEMLSFELTPAGLRFGDKVVMPDEGKSESVTRTLFTDGVEGMTFYAGIQPDELRRYLHYWFLSVTGGLSDEHSFATMVWEAEFDHMTIRVRPELIENKPKDPTENRMQGRLLKLMSDLTQAQEAPEAAVELSSLGVLQRVEAFRDITPEELQRQADAPRAPLESLSDNETQGLVSGLTASIRGSGSRTLLGLWHILRRAPPEARVEIQDFVRRIFGTLIEEGRMTEILRALDRIEGQGPPQADLDAFCDALSSRPLVANLVQKLAEANYDEAFRLLGRLPAVHAEVLVPHLADRTVERRIRLLDLLVAKKPAPEVLAGWGLEHQSSDVAGLLLKVGERLSPEHVDLMIRTLLIHDEPRVRRKGVAAVKTAQVAHHRTLLVQCAEDDDPEVRKAALQVLIRGQEPIAAEFLSRQMEHPDADPALMRMGIQAFTSLQGPRARSALIRLFSDAHRAEYRPQAALALASFGDEEIVRMLEAEARRVLVDREVKEACQEALRRISQKRKASE